MRRRRTARAPKGQEEEEQGITMKTTITTTSCKDDNDTKVSPKDEEIEMVPPFTREQLEGLKRKDLQVLCRNHNIKSTSKVNIISNFFMQGIINTDLRALECRIN